MAHAPLSRHPPNRTWVNKGKRQGQGRSEDPGDLVRQLHDGYGEEVVGVGGGAYGRSGFI
jgi:hypothetical protein